MIKIFIADDHILIREGVKRLIKDESDLELVGETGNAFEVIEFFRKNTCDILILDISLPQKSGLEVLKEIKIFNPSIKVLILSMHPEERFARRALQSGAKGYITKDSAPDELIKAIRIIASGKKYVSPNLAEILASELNHSINQPPHEILSNREFEVLRLLAKGKTPTEIAETLSLSINTISTYRTRILDKLKLHSNADLIRYAIENNLID